MEPSINKEESANRSIVSEVNHVKHLTDRLNLAQSKLKKLSRLEAAILDICLEINDRMKPHDSVRLESNPLHETAAFARHHRKEQLLKKADGDMLSLLNSMRTQLRIHWSIQHQKDEYIDETVTSMTLRQEATQSKLQEQLAQSQAVCDTKQEHIETLIEQISAQQHDKTLLIQHTRRHVEVLTQELESCQQKITQQAQEIQRLDTVATAATASAAAAAATTTVTTHTHSSISLGNTSSSGGDGGITGANHSSGIGGKSLVTSSSTSSLGGNGPIGSVAALEMLQAKRQLKEYEVKLCKMEAQQEEMKAEIQKYQQQLTGFRHSTQTLTITKLERENKRFKEKLEETKRKFDQEEASHLRLRGILKEKEHLIQQMKEEYHKLFLLVQKQQQQQQHTRLSMVRSASLSSVHSSLIDHQGLDGQVSSTNTNISTNTGGMNNGGSIEGTSTVAKLANENPYLLDLYKNKIVELEKQLEHMKLQIRKMIAAEYIQKQKNRLFKEEKHKYLETIDKLQKELEKQIRHSAKIMSNHPPPIMQQQEEDDEQPEQQQHQSHQIKRSSSSSSSSSNSSSSRLARRNTTTLEDIKQLKKRNEYLENRLREILNGSIRNEREEEFDFIGMDEDREEEYKEGKDKEEEEEEEDALEVLRKAQEAYDQENHTPHDDPQEETFFQRQRSKRSLATTTSVSISTQSIGIKLPCNESKNSNISSQQPLQERSSSSTDLKGSTSSNSTSNSYSDSTSSSSVRSIDGELMRQMKARPKTAFVLSSHLRPKNIGGTKSTVIAKSLL